MSTPEPPDLERLRAALASLSEQPDWPEVDAERIFAALHGDLSADERRSVIEELVRNPRAAAAWQLARELAPDAAGAATTAEATESRAHGAAHAAPPPTSRRMWTWAAIAATVLVVVGVGSQLRLWRSEQAPVYRSAGSQGIASRLPPGEPLRRAEPVLRWTPIDGARYRVRILTSDLDLLEEVEDLTSPEYRVGADALLRVPPGGRVLWQVEARVPGAAAVTSPTFEVRVE